MRPAPPLHISSDEVRTLLCVCTCLTATGVAMGNNFQNSSDCHLICNTHVRMCVHVGMVCWCASVGTSECNSPVPKWTHWMCALTPVTTEHGREQVVECRQYTVPVWSADHLAQPHRRAVLPPVGLLPVHTGPCR